MALHDYLCVACGTVVEDIFRPCTERASDRPPTCPDCGAVTEWLPQVGAMDTYDVRTTEVEVRQPDGSHKRERVGSLGDIRRLERETEQAYKNGEGQPLRWRSYSHDNNTRDENSFGPSPAEQLRAEIAAAPKRPRGGDVGVRKGAVVARDHAD